jgi:y4mF family transcriptional regulator
MKEKKRINKPNSPIATFVRGKRKELGYTQEQFALRVGIGLMFLRDLEQGKQSVRLDKVNEVLNYFGYQATPLPKENDGIEK